jgi:hypothetical protein
MQSTPHLRARKERPEESIRQRHDRATINKRMNTATHRHRSNAGRLAVAAWLHRQPRQNNGRGVQQDILQTQQLVAGRRDFSLASHCLGVFVRNTHSQRERTSVPGASVVVARSTVAMTHPSVRQQPRRHTGGGKAGRLGGMINRRCGARSADLQRTAGRRIARQ